MKNEVKYPCPCCGKNILDDKNYFCDNCGWNDCLQDGDEDGGVNIVSLSQAKEFVEQNKNIDGGTLPWDEWFAKTYPNLK